MCLKLSIAQLETKWDGKGERNVCHLLIVKLIPFLRALGLSSASNTPSHLPHATPLATADWLTNCLFWFISMNRLNQFTKQVWTIHLHWIWSSRQQRLFYWNENCLFRAFRKRTEEWTSICRLKAKTNLLVNCSKWLCALLYEPELNHDCNKLYYEHRKWNPK